MRGATEEGPEVGHSTSAELETRLPLQAAGRGDDGAGTLDLSEDRGFSLIPGIPWAASLYGPIPGPAAHAAGYF